MALFEVIKNKNSNKLIWKYPKKNFNMGTKLIVNESEEALFFSNGQALDLFSAGKYTLSTNNIPIIKRLINIPTGGKTAFPCELYFIDKRVHNMKWGTSSKLEFMEPFYNFPIQIGTCGELRFQIENSRKLIIKLIGLNKTFDVENLEDFFSSQILINVKTSFANIIKEEKISIFEIDENLSKISAKLQDVITKDFQEYGINVINFFVTNVAKPEEDKQYLKFKELFFKKGVLVEEAKIDKEISDIEAKKDASKTLITSDALAKKRAMEGYTYKEEREFDALTEMAKNEGVGQFTNMGIGLGIMGETSSIIKDTISKHTTDTLNNENLFCSQCGAKLNTDAIFCSKCGKKVQNEN